MSAWNAERLGTAVIGAGLASLGLFIGWETTAMPAGPAYAAVGPRAFPALIGIALVVIGLLHVRMAVRQGASADDARYDTRAVAWIAGTLIVQMILLRWVGWIPAATLVFVGVCRAFGSRRPGRDALIGVVLAAGTFVLFNLVLGLNLPLGEWVEPLRGR
ncbi:MAG TPA: tripartite tricarboxylate transporter TctB family protein [Ramlibacter sp.]|uniref:tripartite tricarboxylate transporter TctB family protein n=1 Tax=Ramlibacter sp. TaxID=1917967 RepID=UPI002ED42E5D